MGKPTKLPIDIALEARVGARIFIWRQRKRLTARTLARRANLAVNTIYIIENGGGCGVATLSRIATALKLTLIDLIPNTQNYGESKDGSGAQT